MKNLKRTIKNSCQFTIVHG